VSALPLPLPLLYVLTHSLGDDVLLRFLHIYPHSPTYIITCHWATVLLTHSLWYIIYNVCVCVAGWELVPRLVAVVPSSVAVAEAMTRRPPLHLRDLARAPQLSPLAPHLEADPQLLSLDPRCPPVRVEDRSASQRVKLSRYLAAMFLALY
jgi:hypothetical protein